MLTQTDVRPGMVVVFRHPQLGYEYPALCTAVRPRSGKRVYRHFNKALRSRRVIGAEVALPLDFPVVRLAEGDEAAELHDAAVAAGWTPPSVDDEQGRGVVEPGTWRYMVLGTARMRSAVFIRHVSSRGTVYYVKPNPWAFRDGDARAGWTREQAGHLGDVVMGHKPPPFEIAGIEARIGPPAGARAGARAAAAAEVTA